MGQSAYAVIPITQNVASNTKNKNKEQNKMTYFFNIANYGMAGHLFKIVNTYNIICQKYPYKSKSGASEDSRTEGPTPEKNAPIGANLVRVRVVEPKVRLPNKKCP